VVAVLVGQHHAVERVGVFLDGVDDAVHRAGVDKRRRPLRREVGVAREGVRVRRDVDHVHTRTWAAARFNPASRV